MSQEIKCDFCNVEVSFTNATFINNESLCTECYAKIGYMIESNGEVVNEV